MKITNKKYGIIPLILGLMIGMWGLVSCSDDKEDASLRLDKTEISVVNGESARIGVSGVASVTLAVQDESIATAVYSEGIITVTGHKTGQTTLTVTAENGSSATCLIRVTPSDEELNFTGEDASRVEGWLSQTVYTLATRGIVSSFQKNTDAYGLSREGWVAFGVSDPESDQWLRVGFKGNLQEGIKEGGFAVIRNNHSTESYICSQVRIRQVVGIKVWLELKFENRPDIRIVAETL